jgi:hypothetical protein
MALGHHQDPKSAGLRSLILPSLLLFLLLVSPLVHAQIPAEFFAMQANSGVATQPPPWWSNPWPQVKFGTLRLWDASVAWAQINTANGVYDWSLLDKWLDDTQKFNVPDVMYTFGQTPQWASSNPKDPICAPFWLPGECDAPKDLNPDGSGPDQIWKDWVAAIANHSAGRIRYWEVWNEPKNTFFWNGTVAQLVRMAKDARSVILSIDPQAVMLTPPSHGPFQTLYFAAGGPKYADVITYHGYTYRGGCIGFPKASDELTIVSGVRAVMAQYGQTGKPLWDTEMGWGVTADSCFFDKDLQAGFVAQIYMLHRSAAVDRAFWYQYNNQLSGTLWTPNSDPHHRNYPGTLQKAGLAYEKVYQWMVGANMNGQCTVAGTTWTCYLNRPSGYVAQAIWDTSQTCHSGTCGTRKYSVHSQYINYLTLDGNKVKITGGSVPIGYKPILIQNQ